MKIELGVTEEEYMYIESVILLMQDCNEKLIKKVSKHHCVNMKQIIWKWGFK